MVKKQLLNKHKRTIDSAFVGHMDLSPTPARLLLRSSLISVLVLLPPLFYSVVLIWGCYLYLAGIIKYFPAFQADAGIIYTVIYGVFSLLATTVMAFLFRPLFKSEKSDNAIPLGASDEPSLYYLTQSLATRLQVDTVSHIEIGHEMLVDVRYASLKDFYKKELTLRLGLPLISVLRADQISAMIAREYAYYRDNRIKVFYFIMRSVRGWFYRVVNNEDGWSDRIDNFAEKYSNTFARYALTPVYLGISLVSRLFQLFLSAVETLTDQVFYEMAYEADQIQAAFIGIEGFEKLLKRLVKVDQAYQAALEKIISKEHAPENMADLVQANFANESGEPEHFIEMTPADHFNSWHLLPSPTARISRIKGRRYDNIFVLRLPMTELIFDIDTIGNLVSSCFYEKHGIALDNNPAAPDSNEVLFVIPLGKEEQQLRRFTSGLFRRDFVWQLPELDKFAQLSETKAKSFLAKVNANIRQGLPEFNKYIQLVDDYHKYQKTYHLIQWLVKDGSRHRLDTKEVDGAKQFIKSFEEEHVVNLQSYRKLFGIRAAAALSLGRSINTYGKARKLAQMLARLSAMQSAVDAAKIRSFTLRQLLTRRSQGGTEHDRTISRLTKMNLKIINEMEGLMGRLPASLLGRQAETMLGKRLDVDQLSGVDFEYLVVDRYRDLVSCYEGFNTVISARLAQFIESVEHQHRVKSVATVSLGQNHTRPAGTR